MDQPANGFEFLEQLKKTSGKSVLHFKDLNRYLDAKAREKHVPLNGQFELTPLCNFSCRMCYIHLVPEQMKGRSVLPVDTWKDLMHQACPWPPGLQGLAGPVGELEVPLGAWPRFVPTMAPLPASSSRSSRNEPSSAGRLA